MSKMVNSSVFVIIVVDFSEVYTVNLSGGFGELKRGGLRRTSHKHMHNSSQIIINSKHKRTYKTHLINSRNSYKKQSRSKYTYDFF